METTLIFSGVIISIFIELLKKKFEIEGAVTLAVVAGMALGSAVGYYMLQKYGFLESFLQIMTTAGAFYAFIIKTVKGDPIVSAPVKKKKK